MTYDFAAKAGLNAAMTVTFAAGLFVAPFFLFSATAGQVADKCEKAWLIRTLQKIQILLTITCCICFWQGYLYALIAILFLMTVNTTFFGPVKYSILPDHLKSRELMAGNSLIEAATFLSILAGAIFGGLSIRAENGISLFASVVILSSITSWVCSRFIPFATPDDPDLPIRWNLLTQTWKVLGYARSTRIVWLAIIGISWFWLCGGVFLTQFPNFTKNIIGGNEQVNILWLVVFSCGIALGSLACSKIQGEAIHGRLVPYGLGGVMLGMLGLVWAASVYHYPSDALLDIASFLARGAISWTLIGTLFFLAFCGGINIVPLYVIMQHHAPHQYRSRIIAANNILNALFMVIASIAVFALYAIGLDIVEIFALIGVLNIVTYVAIRKLCS